MKSRSAIIVACTILLLSCSENSGIEESVKIYDDDMNDRFIHLLKEDNVSYRIASDGQIFYPIEQRNNVKKAQEVIFDPIDESKKGASVQRRDADTIASKLTSLGINYEIFHDENQSTFTWGSSVNTEAMRVVGEVISKSENSEE